MSSPRNVSQQVGLLKTLVNRGRLVWRLIRDPRVPVYLKAIPVVAAVYVVSPLDLIPDFVVGLGQLDDIGILLAGVEGFIALCPPLVVAEHSSAIERDAPFTAGTSSGETIDGEWRMK
jgi:uncharacterized membrane protein YkvA (DUF1232 family)